MIRTDFSLAPWTLMHRLVLILSVAGLLVGAAAAQPEELSRRLATANEAYEEGRYSRAVELYERLLESGYTNGALYYNLGNAYARIDRPGPAIRYYEKARRLLPADSRIPHNLEQVRREAGVYPEQIQQSATGLRGVVQSMSPLALLIAGLLMMVGGGGISILWTRPDRPEGWQHPLAWGPVAAGLLLAAAAMGTSYLQSLDRYGVVVTGEATLRSEPRTAAAPDTTLPEGTMLTVRRHTDRWYKVRLGDATTGWLPARVVGEI